MNKKGKQIERDKQLNLHIHKPGITIPNTVTTIHREAFRNCSDLGSIKLPDIAAERVKVLI